MGRTIKTRHVQKDIKVLDKTVTAAEHMKGAYIRTRDSAEQTHVKEQSNPVGYAEEQVKENGERVARGTVQQAGKQGKKVISAVREKGRAEKEAETFRERNRGPSASSFSSGTEESYQPKEQMKNRAGAQNGRTAGEHTTVGKEAGKKGAQIREFPKQTIKTVERGEKTIKTAHASVKTSGKAAVKGAGRTIKTAERTGHTAVRTTEVTARAAAQGARTAVMTTQRTAFVARQAAIVTAQATKAAAKAVTASVKAAIAAVKSLVSAILAGGWIVVLILLIVILFGALFSQR